MRIPSFSLLRLYCSSSSSSSLPLTSWTMDTGTGSGMPISSSGIGNPAGQVPSRSQPPRNILIYTYTQRMRCEVRRAVFQAPEIAHHNRQGQRVFQLVPEGQALPNSPNTVVPYTIIFFSKRWGHNFTQFCNGLARFSWGSVSARIGDSR